MGANHVNAQVLRRNVQAHIQNALVNAQRSDELDNAARTAAHNVLAFAHVQEEHPTGDRKTLEASKALALESIDRLAEILMRTEPSERANILRI